MSSLDKLKTANYEYNDVCASNLPDNITNNVNPDNNQFNIKYKVGELICHASSVNKFVSIPSSEDSVEFVAREESSSQSPSHYILIPDSQPYKITGKDQEIILNNSPQMLLKQIASNEEFSIYKLPQDTVTLTSVIMDALPRHTEIIENVFGKLITGLEELATKTECLPTSLKIKDLCASRKNGLLYLVPPIKFQAYDDPNSLQSQLHSIVDSLASEVYKRAANTNKRAYKGEFLNNLI